MLGQYRSDAVTATYNFSSDGLREPTKWLANSLDHALTETIRRHPSLCYGIIEQTAQSEAKFVQLRGIHRDDVIKFCEVGSNNTDLDNTSKETKEDELLSKYLGTAHEALWAGGDNQPAWKVIVLNHQNYSGHSQASQSLLDLTPHRRNRVDVIFLAHHAIADGLSGIAFHKSLLEALCRVKVGACETSPWPYIVPDNIAAPMPVEQLLDLSTTASDALPESPTFAAWTGEDPTILSHQEYISCVRITTIAAEYVSQVLKTCKKLKITLTGYLHGLIILFLARSVKDAQAFCSVTPYSLRPFTGAAAEDIVNHISYVVNNTNRELLDQIRNTQPELKGDMELLAKIAHQFRDHMASEISQFPKKSALFELSRVVDVYNYCRAQMDEKRGCTYELSNLGVAQIGGCPEGHNSDFPLYFEKLTFTQCGMVVGPAIGCNIVSAKGGPLVIAFTWQKGVVEDGLVADLADTIQSYMSAED